MQLLHRFIFVGDWSSGMIGVSKTFGGGSIPSSPVSDIRKERLFVCLLNKVNTKVNTNPKSNVMSIKQFVFIRLLFNL